MIPPFKFRIWDKRSKKMYYPDKIQFGIGSIAPDAFVAWYDDEEEDFIDTIYDNVVVMPCIQLNKNGYIEFFFENDVIDYYDIAQDKGVFGLVIWDQESACYYLKIGDELLMFDEIELSMAKIVGNIYENPELGAKL